MVAVKAAADPAAAVAAADRRCAVGTATRFGNVLFAASSKHGLVSLTSVLASLYPVVTVMLAAWLLHERVTRCQRGGIVLALLGVVLIGV